MAAVVYILCFLTSALCALLLIRAYFASKRRFLLMCALSFVLITANNFMVFADLVLLPDGTLVGPRQFVLIIAIGVMIYGFMWELD
jgi:hypothetical protein